MNVGVRDRENIVVGSPVGAFKKNTYVVKPRFIIPEHPAFRGTNGVTASRGNLKEEITYWVEFGGNPELFERWSKMRKNVPQYMDSVFNNTTDAFCDILHNPSLWSEKIIKETLTRTGSQPFNIEDVQTLVKDYLTVLSEHIRRGEEL